MISGKRILADFKVYSRGYLRNRVGLFFGLVFPVILILIFGAIFSGTSSGTVTVYVQNQDGGPVAGQFLRDAPSTGELNSSERSMMVSPTTDLRPISRTIPRRTAS